MGCGSDIMRLSLANMLFSQGVCVKRRFRRQISDFRPLRGGGDVSVTGMFEAFPIKLFLQPVVSAVSWADHRHHRADVVLNPGDNGIRVSVARF